VSGDAAIDVGSELNHVKLDEIVPGGRGDVDLRVDIAARVRGAAFVVEFG